jgi:sugar transferase (PEP-CTERM/EpsH1 system associated)
MADLLYLVHRLPYPPNKGDKVRSFHLLRHLCARHRVHLGTFIDDPDDERHVDTVRSLCASLHVESLGAYSARMRALSGLVRGEALTVPYYRSASLTAWVDRTVREHRLQATVVFSSTMAQYVPTLPGMVTLVDMVDVDSAKWTQYAGNHGWPMSWVYRREGRKLLEFEKAAVQQATRAFLVTEAEADLFARLAPECAGQVDVVGNGVDADYFDAARGIASPFGPDEVPIVFTGAMDYLPNIDAVKWFATEALPRIASLNSAVRFYVVGRGPTPDVLALASDRVAVTGTVVDVRPYLAHARVVVAPLRIARGVQNKVLEAMAMGRPVIASSACAGAIEARPGTDLEVASDADGFVERILALLGESARAEAMGRSARACVLARYSWDARLARFDQLLGGGDTPSDPAGRGTIDPPRGAWHRPGVAA